ncbi:MAG: substrate-binding domain-containing protein [Eubacterium sp.]|nr:substrate-binding domain-containing protein [Eubacterium sp.]
MFFITVLIGIVFFYVRIRFTQNIITSSDYKTYDNYYVIITGNSDTDYWKSIYAGAKAEAEKLSVNVEMMGEGLDKNLTKEDYLRIAISSSVDGIIIEGDDDPEIQELLAKADANGIPVVTVSEDSPSSGRKSFIGVSSNNMGKEYGNQIVEYANEVDADSLSVMVLIDKGMTESSQTVIMTAIRESLVENGLSDKVSLDSKIVSSDVDYAAEEEIRDIFVGKEDIPDIMVCLSEQNTICAYQTVVDHNKVGQVEIFGYYMSDTIRSAIKKDIIRSSIVVDTEELGLNAVKAIDEYKESGYVSEIYLIDTKLANSDNIASFNMEGGESDD